MFLQNRFFQRQLLDAMKMCGSLDPERILSYIEESLTLEETKETEKFLKWLQAEHKIIGWNLSEAVKRYLKGRTR